MAKKQAPQPSETQTPVEAPTPPSEPISFAEPVNQVAEGVVLSDEAPAGFVDPKPAAPPKSIELTDREFQALHAEASAENDKVNFLQKLAEANKPVEEPAQYAGPIPERVAEQTKAEMAAGAKLVAQAAAQDAQRGPRPPDPYAAQARAEGSRNTEVLRPDRFDEYRAQFKSPAQTQSKDTGMPQLQRG